MEVTLHSLIEGVHCARGLVVVVDVYRAFTCTPLLYAMGIVEDILVSTPEEAFRLRDQDPDLLLVGEVEGKPIQGFDLGNSPSQILRLGSSFFEGKRVVQRTSSGVQGALAALEVADEVLVGSYTLARATARYILSRRPPRVSIVAMGWSLRIIAPEDEWCARYIAHLLGASPYDHHQALREILFHGTTQKFLRGQRSYFPPEDPVLCLQRDIFDFALGVRREENRVKVFKVS